MPLKTLFLNPPSFENFDGGAGSRWPATREIESYWYPVWLAYPAGMLEGARLLDAPPHYVSAEDTIKIAQDYEFLVLFTSTPGFPGYIRLAQKIKDANPKIKVGFVGPHVSVLPEKSLKDCSAIDFVCRKEFDYSVVEYAQGKPLEEILGISYRKNGSVVHNPDRPQIENLDALPHVTDIYRRDLDVRKYNVPFLLHPYVSLYTTRGCPAQCTFCLWPQTTSGHAWRKRSSDDVAAEMAKAKEYWPYVKEFFFDDDTFNIQKARTVELCAKLKPLKLTWSCTSRVTTDYETVFVLLHDDDLADHLRMPLAAVLIAEDVVFAGDGRQIPGAHVAVGHHIELVAEGGNAEIVDDVLAGAGDLDGPIDGQVEFVDLADAVG